MGYGQALLFPLFSQLEPSASGVCPPYGKEAVCQFVPLILISMGTVEKRMSMNYGQLLFPFSPAVVSLILLLGLRGH